MRAVLVGVLVLSLLDGGTSGVFAGWELSLNLSDEAEFVSFLLLDKICKGLTCFGVWFFYLLQLGRAFDFFFHIVL